MKLSFIVVGAAKSGTTALHQSLDQIKCLSLFRAKDSHFFDHDEIFQRGETWYWQQFENKTSDRVLYGEVSANYLYSDTALQRIKAFGQPNIKVITLLRDPLERLISEYKHHTRNGLLSQPLSYYLSNPEATNEGTRYKPWHLLVERSLYQDKVNNLFTHFPKENIKIIKTKIFQTSPQQCINELCEFIGASKQTISPISANKAFTPHSTSLMAILAKENVFTRILKPLVPSFKLRQIIRHWIIGMNTSSKSKIYVTEEEKIQARNILTELGAYEFKF